MPYAIMHEIVFLIYIFITYQKKKKNLGNKDVPLNDNHGGSSFVNHTLPWEYIKQNIMWQQKLTTIIMR